MTARVSALRAERREDTAFVATAEPALTWSVSSDAADWLQVGAELTDGRHTVELRGRDSVLVPWPFPSLSPGERREVRVRVTAVEGTRTDWSEPLPVDAGFLAPGEWVAEPVGLANPPADAHPVVLRTGFTLTGPVERVLLFWTALGVAEPRLNGLPVSNDVLAPGWSAYRDRLVHETVDVTALIRDGENELGAELAGGWYTERYGFGGGAARVYGEQPAFLAQLRVVRADGSHETVAATGPAWVARGDGPVVASGIYAGEHQDLRRSGALASDTGDAGFAPVRVGAAALPGYGSVPVPEPRIAPPVRRVETRAVVAVVPSPTGGRILDVGQNLVGRLRLRVRGARGTRITIRHAEVLEDGALCLRPLRAAAATASFDLAGDGEELLESRFTFFGFRYAEITGADVDPADVEAVVLQTDMTRTGWFGSSDPLLDRLHENVVQGMRGNFLAVPTDCPQRDERLGWTGDIQVFAPTAAFLYDCDGFLRSWLRDLGAEQRRDGGSVPVVVPSVLGTFLPGTVTSPAAWGDAATVVPTVLFERFGDLAAIDAQYDSMRDWVEAVLRDAGDSGLWAGRMQLGDWLDPSAPPDRPAQARVDSDIVASAYLARSLRLVAEAAALRGDDADAARYDALAERSRAAFEAEYVTAAGRMMSDAPTAYALALRFDLVRDGARRQALADRLAGLVREDGYRIGTGFVGTPLVADALTDGGHLETAERLLLQTDAPSWLYPVTRGATTVWERWDSLLPDGSVNPGEMTSFNHVALGAVADWLHRTVAGLAPDAPGYARIRIAPRPLRALRHASARHRTPYGEALISWRRADARVIVTAVVPENTTAVVDLPGREPFEVGSGHHGWTFAAPVGAAREPLPGLDASLADVIDDPAAYAAVLDTVRAADPERAERLRTETRWIAGRPLATALLFSPPPLLASVDAAVRAATAR